MNLKSSRSALLALGISILWGANIVAIKVGLLAIPPFWSAFWRMLLGVIVVSLWAVRQRVSLRAAPLE